MMRRSYGYTRRAGKVRSQTPRVEADTFRKKLKTGRAKKRFLYNTRVLNPTGCGPNQQKEGISVHDADSAPGLCNRMPKKFTLLASEYESDFQPEKFQRSHHKKTKGCSGLEVALEKAQFSRNLAQVALLNAM